MGDSDGVIAAFYSDVAPEKWRLSFVRLDSSFTDDGKLETTITPANRSSFLVGEDEPVNTAREQLFPLFADDETLPAPNDLTEAFGIERVTKEFFDDYKRKYFQLCDLLNANAKFKTAAKTFTAEQFAKKLLGQIVFLYFLQKKGWLGVDQNSPWGSGHVKFVRKIFDGCKRDGRNFFRDVLEPLFYTALNDGERPDDFYAPLNTRIPFLNGGLFEPLDENWRTHDFKLDNEIFSDGEGNGILDIFDRYNFTICEDAPKEHEVAVDPEMLGKIFEDLLESGDRKSKGAFYTPREIVSRMCRETLIDYLVERTKIPAEAVTNFITHGEELRDADAENLRTGQPLKLDAQIFNRSKEIDDLLANVKVADPAVGSGAFPLGMLTEIVTARDVLTTYLRDESESRRPYALKLDTIKNCIFACDNDPSACDIAKLRLWLSIVIDDAPRPDEKNFTPHRLPNLDCNIICGNSLVDAFAGIPLLTTSKFFDNFDTVKQGTLFYQGDVDKTVERLIDLQHELFDESNYDRKKVLRAEIKRIYDKIVDIQLAGNDDIRKKYSVAAQKRSLPFVLWPLYFPTVFRDGGAFDIVIGNPPYDAKLDADSKKFCKKVYRCAKTIAGVQKGSTDTFALFIERAFDLCATGGVVSLIVPMSFTSSDAMTALHNLLEQNCRKLQVSSYSNRPQQIFSSACVRTSIVSFIKTLTPVEEIFTSKLMRRNENHTLDKIMSDLTFVESSEFKLPGRYPKIGDERQREILSKIFHAPKHLADFADIDGEPFYYRVSGGRYFNIVTPYPTGSTKEAQYRVKKPFAKLFGATLSTSLFWFYQQVYMNGLDIKRFELDTFPTFDADRLSPAQLACVEKLYDDYLADIERNTRANFATGSVYQRSGTKIYKIVRSKDLADALDDVIGELYGLSAAEIEFVKTFEQEFRVGD